MKTILCAECNKQIKEKKDLVVAGKLMLPYHKLCLEKPNSNLGKLHKFTGKFPTGIRFWFLMYIHNIGEMLRRNPESFTVIIFFGLIFNIVFIGARVGIYFSYEQIFEE